MVSFSRTGTPASAPAAAIPAPIRPAPTTASFFTGRAWVPSG